METFFIKAAQLIVALLLLVVIHEFGHYIFARMFGIKVNRFYLFFNPWFSLLKYYPEKGKIEIIAWTRKIKKKNAEGKEEEVGEEPRSLFTLKAGKPHSPVNKKGRPSWAATVYGLGWLPLGGYCDIAGMVDETKSAKDLASEPQPWEFRTKAAWKRFLVMIAGVTFNFILAIVIYAGIAYYWGDRVIPFRSATEGLEYSEPMLSAGLHNGDILLTINGKEADAMQPSLNWDIMQPGTHLGVLRDHRDTVQVTIPATVLDECAAANTPPILGYRFPIYVEKVQGGQPAAEAGVRENDRIVRIGNDSTPSQVEFYKALEASKGRTTTITVDRGGADTTLPITISEEGKIGIQLRAATDIYPVEHKHYSLLASVPRGWEIGTEQLTTYVSSLKMLFTKEGVKQVGGFGTIGGLFPEKWNWESFWSITAFLSVVLAFMNILPIPALDGGYVLFLLWEMVTRKKPSDKFMTAVNYAGFMFLLLLLLLANGNDILRAFR